MDTVITTYDPLDLGAGPQTTHTVAASKFKTDPAGNLIVYAEGRDHDDSGSLALNQQEWRSAVRGTVVHENDRVNLVRRHAPVSA